MLIRDKFQVQQCQTNSTSNVYLMLEIEEYQLCFPNPFGLSQALVLLVVVALVAL